MFLLAPVLLLAEIGLTLVSIREGWFRAKLRGWRWCAAHRRWVIRHRRRLQAVRTVPDRDLAPHLTPILDPAMIELPRAVQFANPMLAAYLLDSDAETPTLSNLARRVLGHMMIDPAEVFGTGKNVPRDASSVNSSNVVSFMTVTGTAPSGAQTNEDANRRPRA